METTTYRAGGAKVKETRLPLDGLDRLDADLAALWREVHGGVTDLAALRAVAGRAMVHLVDVTAGDPHAFRVVDFDARSLMPGGRSGFFVGEIESDAIREAVARDYLHVAATGEPRLTRNFIHVPGVGSRTPLRLTAPLQPAQHCRQILVCAAYERRGLAPGLRAHLRPADREEPRAAYLRARRGEAAGPGEQPRARVAEAAPETPPMGRLEAVADGPVGALGDADGAGGAA